MAIFTTADGRQIVGAAQAGNEYKGYAGRREIVIQLTATGATQDSLDALEFLKSYAVYHNSVGEPIFPASTNVFISNNGVTKAVEADEVTVDGASVNIGGCVWNGTAWDFSNAGQSGGGGGSSGGGVLVLHVDDETFALDKTWKEISDAGFSVVMYPTPSGADACIFVGAYNSSGSYKVRFAHPYTEQSSGATTVGFGLFEFATDSENGYPALSV